jgi:hypothetical protein
MQEAHLRVVGGVDKGSPIRVWDRAGQGPTRELDGPLDTIHSLLRCGDGIALGASGPTLGLLTSDGGRRLWREGEQPDLRGRRGQDFSVASDGRRVRFGLEPLGASPVLFDLATEQLRNSPNRPTDLAEADTMSLLLRTGTIPPIKCCRHSDRSRSN